MMPKKKKSTTPLKKPLQAGDKPGIQQKEQGTKPCKFGQEIDDIFAGSKTKKKPELQIPQKKDTKVEIAKLKRKRTELDNGFDNNSKRLPRKKTIEGFTVYTEDELCVNNPNAGDTPLCPFDCNCCF